MQDWQEIVTGDRYTAICCRVRVMISYSALTHIIERGQQAFDALDDEARMQYSLLEDK
jgi:hypothetical protein